MNLPARKNKTYPAIMEVRLSKDRIVALMSDGREVAIPTAWFARLANATFKQLKNFEISPGGYGIHWPDIDEDISVKAFFD